MSIRPPDEGAGEIANAIRDGRAQVEYANMREASQHTRILVPASPAEPAATQNKQHHNKDDEKRRVIHHCLLSLGMSESSDL